MTQQEQHEFRESLEEALSWMQTVQERLQQNDDTQGPISALEARLRETEKIHSSKTEGHVKMDRVLVESETLLQNGDEEMKNQTHSKLKHLKALWDETLINIIHCHSRIEWAWLHWSEYLKTHEVFGMWLEKMQRSLEPQLELQLGLQEKLWQVHHLQVLHSDIQDHAVFLETLLDEAAALFNRTEDPSIDEQAQQSLQDAYSRIRDVAQERLTLARKIAENHQQYQTCVHELQTWLGSKVEDISCITDMQDTTQNKLKALQELDGSIAKEEPTLQHIEGLSEVVKTNTSPAGAEKITGEVEELRSSWQKLRQTLAKVLEKLQSSLDSESEYSDLCKQLWTDLARIRTLVQNLSIELESRDEEMTEEHMVAQWKTRMRVWNKLTTEEHKVEELKFQMKELFRFAQDSRALSDELLAVMREYQSVKGRSFRLSSESEMCLQQMLLDPLYGFSQWSQEVSQVLDASTDVSEIALLVQSIEKLLRSSVQWQERLSSLQVKSDLLASVFGQKKAEDLLKELSSDVKKRELLHTQLQQHKNHLQGLITKTEDFPDACDSILKKLSSVQERFTTDDLQPNVPAKKSQADQLRMKVSESEENIVEHECFHDSILSLEKWMMIMRQKLESFRGSDGQWSIDNRQHDAERTLCEVQEKELQLHQIQAQGQSVQARTSDEDKVHILQDLKRLRESWNSLHTLSHSLYRFLNGDAATDGQDYLSHRTEFLVTCAEGRHKGSESGIASGTHRHQKLDGEFHQDSESTELEPESEASYRSIWIRKSAGMGTGERVEEQISGSEMEDLDVHSFLSADHTDDTHRRPQPAVETSVGYSSVTGTQTGSQGPHHDSDTGALQREFEDWLHKENDKLTGLVTSQRSLSPAELKRRHNTLKGLCAGVSWGQTRLQRLMAESSVDEDVKLVDLRYHWILYKSRLKEATEKLEDASAQGQKLVRAGKQSSSVGFLYRVCCAALPLQLLLLALLLLIFLLPMMDEGTVCCSLSNNFARSFNIMLRYDGPPPT